MLVDQLRADRSRGLNTAAFVSGYPGSPLGGFDQTLQRMDKSQLNIHHVSGLNEELAATAIWGSQKNHLAPLKDLDGVIGMWYGKTPGLDRSVDTDFLARQGARSDRHPVTTTQLKIGDLGGQTI